MFSLKKRYSLLSSTVLSESVDCHSHILPGVDDGIESINEATDVLNGFEQIGIKKVILTPHINLQYPKNDYAFLKKKYEELSLSYAGEVKTQLGAEYMLDAGFEKQLESGDVLSLFDKHILIECPGLDCPYDFINRINFIMSSGYFVVLAHPERYYFLDENKYFRLKEMGVKYQLNLFSLLGAYGELVRRKARLLLQHDSYDLWGTDLHAEDAMCYFNRKRLTKEEVNSLCLLKNRMNDLI